MRDADRLDRRVVIKVLVAVPVARLDPPRLAFGRDVELGQLLGNAGLALVDAFRKFVAEADAIIEHAHPHGKFARHVVLLAEGRGKFVVLVGDVAALAPRLLPRLLRAVGGFRHEFEIASQRVFVLDVETEARWGNQFGTIAGDRPHGLAFAIDIERRRDRSIGRGDRSGQCRMRTGESESGDEIAHGQISSISAA